MAEVRTNRRLAAILAADVAGYSRLMGANEEGTLARLTADRRELFDPTIAKHRGRIVKTTGDGLLAEFASVVDAVRCAVEVQAGMSDRNTAGGGDPPLEFRIGINVGDIVEQDGDIFGEGVNIAARLESIAEPGGICVSQRVQEDATGRTGTIFEDMGERSLKNIDRPVRAYRVRTDRIRPTQAPASQGTTGLLALPDKPSIAVLPFQNMSGDPEQEYFADGIVEDIITGLSRIRWLFVIARNSTYVYKHKAVDIRQVGRELGVRYVVEGGVRKMGNRLRVTAQLIEAQTGAHLWADKYDGAIEDVFEFQDQITGRVVGIVEPSLQRSEIERSRHKRPDNLDAYDLYLRALPYTATQMPGDALTAIGFLSRALKLEPEYTAAHALIAWCHEWCFARSGFDEAHRVEGLSHARSVIVSSTDDAAALAIAGFVIILLSGDREVALNTVERALAFNPSCATALYLAAQIHSFAGHSRVAVDYALRALRLSPFDFLAYEAYLAQGQAAVKEGQYDEAAVHFAKAIQNNPGNSSNYILHAIALGLAGRAKEAAPSIKRGLELEPGFRARWFYEFSIPEIADKLAEGARLLGLPT